MKNITQRKVLTSKLLVSEGARMNRRAVLFTALIITCMTAASEGLREPEVIFPEIAAIATGALLAPKLVWRVDKKRIFSFIMLCAVLGMAIVLYCPFTLTIQMMLAFIVGVFCKPFLQKVAK